MNEFIHAHPQLGWALFVGLSALVLAALAGLVVATKFKDPGDQ